MPKLKFGRPALVSLSIAAGLGLMLLAVTSFRSQEAVAQAPNVVGDGTVIFGGAASGGSTAVNVAVGAAANYVISATVPNCASDRPGGVDTWSVESWAVGADSVDERCIFVPATTRRGTMHDNSTYPPPLVQAPPVPTPYRPLTPRLACAGTCYLEWEIDEVPISNSVARVKISRVDARPREGACDWPTKTVFGTYQVGDDEKTLTAITDAPVLPLAGAFVDQGKPALLVYRGTAVWAVRTLTGPTRKTHFFEYDYGECAEWDCCCGC